MSYLRPCINSAKQAFESFFKRLARDVRIYLVDCKELSAFVSAMYVLKNCQCVEFCLDLMLQHRYTKWHPDNLRLLYKYAKIHYRSPMCGAFSPGGDPKYDVVNQILFYLLVVDKMQRDGIAAESSEKENYSIYPQYVPTFQALLLQQYAVVQEIYTGRNGRKSVSSPCGGGD